VQADQVDVVEVVEATAGACVSGEDLFDQIGG
jgi:hypothetical protein